MKIVENNNPKIALIGRTNVGKSTIFNRLTEGANAITSKIAGTTRDKRTGECLWQGKTITLVDTAGLDVQSDTAIDKESIKQAKATLKQVDFIFFIVDVKDGLLPQDKEFAKLINKSDKKSYLVINKVDSNKYLNETGDFHKLGFNKIFLISAKTGRGLGDLLDSIYDEFVFEENDESEEEELTNQVKIAIIGKPNVGKSSLINKITGENRSIVSHVPHTTRDSQDITIEHEYNDEKFHLTFIDTAGIIKKRKIDDHLKQKSIDQSISSLKKSDFVLLVIDISEDITMQDKHLANEILENNKSLIIIVNKWDLIKDKDTHSDKEYTLNVQKSFPYLTWAPIVFTSALTGSKMKNVLRMAIEIHKQNEIEIGQEAMDELKAYMVRKQAPQKSKGTKRPFLHTLEQVGKYPLTFKILTDQPENVHFSYQRFIKNQIRKRFNLQCGIKLFFDKK